MIKKTKEERNMRLRILNFRTTEDKRKYRLILLSFSKISQEYIEKLKREGERYDSDRS